MLICYIDCFVVKEHTYKNAKQRTFLIYVTRCSYATWFRYKCVWGLSITTFNFSKILLTFRGYRFWFRWTDSIDARHRIYATLFYKDFFLIEYFFFLFLRLVHWYFHIRVTNDCSHLVKQQERYLVAYKCYLCFLEILKMLILSFLFAETIKAKQINSRMQLCQ